MRLGGKAQEGQLLPGPVLSSAKPPRAAESHLRRRRLDLNRDLPHAQKRGFPPRSGRRALREPRPRRKSQAPGCSAQKAWLRGHTAPPCRGRLMIPPIPRRSTAPPGPLIEFLPSEAKQSRGQQRQARGMLLLDRHGGQGRLDDVAELFNRIPYYFEKATACMFRPGMKVKAPAITSAPANSKIIARLCAVTR